MELTNKARPNASPQILTRRAAVMLGVTALFGAGCAGRPMRRRRRRWRGIRGGEAEPIGSSQPDQLLERYRERSAVTNFSVRVLRKGAILYTQDVGSHGPTTQINIASASKWLVGATAMAQVDAGRFRLEDRVGEYIPGLRAEYASLRLDQLLSFTAGLPSLKSFVEFRQPEDISLAESARLAARRRLASSPGTQFDYGGANLQFVGAAIEAVNGLSWHQVFQRDIAAPLNMRRTAWGRLDDRPSPALPISNPIMQAGAWTTADEYAAFLTMIALGGTVGGRRILTRDAILGLATLSTLGLRKGFIAPGAEGQNVEYLLAHWCERIEPANAAPRCGFESSPGFYGTYPWIDRRTGIYGVIFQKDRLQRVADDTRELRNKLIEFYGA